MLNKYKHKDYNPNLDTIFGRYLYKGLTEEAEKYLISQENAPTKIPSVSDFIGTK